MEGREPVPRSVDEDTAIDEVVLQVFGVWRRSGDSGRVSGRFSMSLHLEAARTSIRGIVRRSG